MLPRLVPILALGLLAGCASSDRESYHLATLEAIEQSEANLSNQINNLQLQLSNQTDYIESLETEIEEMTVHLSKVTALFSLPPEPKVEEEEEEPIVQQSYSYSPTATYVLGEIEKVSIGSIPTQFDARVDTGAATSSINAVDIEEFERNGQTWVRFHLTDGETTLDESNWIEAPVVRSVKIRQSTSEEVERRKVVELWIKLGEIHEKAQFTLADRSQMSHPVLLGREFIRDIAVVDISRKYLHTEIK
ncbi:ATP-dependent zinc protease [Vibrio mexicanus]|uniref:ATP-dependent zinc protease family protein n=1 Tax=Vibrio mexicanus TaxID=1004326 RepID=UPI00063C36F5|nr:ATP-dependent zinc protease [Vibrio mexicanus]